MYLDVRNNNLVYRQFNREVKLPIANMTKKIYDYNRKIVMITVTVSKMPRQFNFFFSEIQRPSFSNFDAMVLWFDENVILPTGVSQTQLDNLSSNIDGGNPESIYLIDQVINGGTP